MATILDTKDALAKDVSVLVDKYYLKKPKTVKFGTLGSLRILTAGDSAIGIASAGSEPQKPQFFVGDANHLLQLAMEAEIYLNYEPKYSPFEMTLNFD